ncbi:MAG: GrpB family protein [Pyrinomonadaceae bacterium]
MELSERGITRHRHQLYDVAISNIINSWVAHGDVALKKSLEQRIKEAIREDISIAPYDSRWPKLYKDEAAFLRHNLPKSVVIRIEHFGSTAVPGLAAKPVIDMLVQVSSLAETQEQIVPMLEAEGYDYFWRTDVSPPYAWFIKRGSGGRRTHHIHMVEVDSKLWERLYFRDYLRDFPEEAKRYAELKRLLAEKHPNDRVAYTAGKAEYIMSITERAKRHYGAA